jgi:hypothetical protein
LKSGIALDRIVDLPEAREVRAGGISQEHAQLMVPSVQTLTPVDVVKLIDGRFGLLAGYHRREAHRLAGMKTIKVVVHDLEPEEWFAFAVRSNIAHGLPLTLKERRAAAKRMVVENGRRADRAIAADCGLDHKTVARVREALLQEQAESTGEFPQLPEARVGRDGKTRRVPKPMPDILARQEMEILAADDAEAAAALDGQLTVYDALQEDGLPPDAATAPGNGQSQSTVPTAARTVDVKTPPVSWVAQELAAKYCFEVGERLNKVAHRDERTAEYLAGNGVSRRDVARWLKSLAAEVLGLAAMYSEVEEVEV